MHSGLSTARRFSRGFSRTAVLAGVGAATLAIAIAPASAHVTVTPSTAAAGAYTTLTFKVPTEADNASTTGLDVQFPADTPIASVSVRPKAGWDYKITKAKPSKPLTTDDGQVDEVVSRITWTAAPGSAGIKPGEFDTFDVSAGPLPTGAGSIVFKSLQTYSNGNVVRWVDLAAAGQPEPDHPAPTVTLTSATADSSGSTSTSGSASASPAAAATGGDGDDDTTARTLGIIGIVIGVLAGALSAVYGIRAARRQA
ncbi:YcnI-like domain-containing protein [Frankia sp. AiPs1]|uniref:YcnI family copper-binding membrane protein n=1 Tax=Frankia sp. AiPa1 TaxID=573492 RepID=UPI00202B9705|nr:YcnI family protein [Frankia sp. AiPa1]MCL9760775.1 YcnI family protein [Frankia sp. AiPa1]